MGMNRSQAWKLWVPCLSLVILGVVWRGLTLPYGVAAYRHVLGWLVYSDVVTFYSERAVAAHAIPYVEQNVEYPVIIGLVIWLTGFAPGVGGYFLANAVVLGACALACLVLLSRMGPQVRTARYALAPGLALYTVLNWDMLGVLALTAGLYYFQRRQPGRAGFSLGLGLSAKLFPGFVLPVMLACCLRTPASERSILAALRDWRGLVTPGALRLLGGFLVPVLVINLPFAVLNFRGWSHFWTFQSGRDRNFDSFWSLLPSVTRHRVDVVFTWGFLVGVLLVSWCVWRGASWEAGALLSLLLFLLLTKVYSPQYDLWILPLLAILACPLRLWVIYILADLAYYVAIFVFLHSFTGGQSPLGDVPTLRGLLELSIVSREFVLGLLVVWALGRPGFPNIMGDASE